jgi:hypothetical protein
MRNNYLLLGISSLVLVVMLTACCLGQIQPSQDFTAVDVNGTTSINASLLRSAIVQMPRGNLSDVEKEGVLYMREEEKLAHDAYLTLYEKWNLRIFDNIARSEQTHMDAIKTLIDTYGLEDPALNETGVFTNSELQGLYYTLVDRGNNSLQDALEVGAAIEELDILDLKGYIAETDKVDLTVVYENLMKGSRNHLRAFVSTLERHGFEYTPQYLNQTEYDAIISSPIEQGRGGM